MSKGLVEAPEFPDIVFSPNLVVSPIFGDVYDRFVEERGQSKGATCKKTAKPGDLYLFYFGEPELKIAGLAICKNSPEPKGEKEPDWPSKMFFCTMDNLHHCRAPITAGELKSGHLLSAWWKTIPYRGRPKSIPAEVANRLLTTIAEREPVVAPILRGYIYGLRDASAVSPKSKVDRLLEAFEGTPYERLARQRGRSQALRKEKIRQAMKANSDRLVCEVKGCGFDFEETYGMLGRGFAHVHHLRPLAKRNKTRTGLDDLAIVCANCHAMIHKGGLCRPLKGLLTVHDHVKSKSR